MSKQGTGGNRKHITLMILQKIEITRRLNHSKSHSVVMASYNTGLSIIYDINGERRKEREKLDPWYNWLAKVGE
jgi:hypothetical protein